MPRKPSPVNDNIHINGRTVTIDEIRERYEKRGMSWAEIAKEFGTYANKIARFAQKHGVAPRDNSTAQKKLFERGVRKSPTEGKQHSLETKEKISKKQAKTWENMTDEEHRKRCKMSKELWDSKSKEEIDALRKAATEGVLKAAQDGSKIEKYLQQKLRDAGYVIEPHKEDLLSGVKTHIDIFLPTLQTAIEIDGPAHFSPIWGQEKLHKHQEKDRKKNARLIGAGFTVVRVKYMISSSSLAKMRYAADEVLKVVNQIQNDPKKHHNILIEIEVK